MVWFSQIVDQLWRSWQYLTTGRVLATVLGIGFALLAVTLLIASRTKWGQAKPLTKCVVVSVLLHVWLLMYALGSRSVLPQGSLDGVEQNLSVAFEASQETMLAPDALQHQAFTPATEPTEVPPWEEKIPLENLPKPPELDSMKFGADLAAPALLPKLEPTPMPALPPEEVLADLSKPESTTADSLSHDSSAELTSDVSDMTAVLPPSMPALEATGTQPPSVEVTPLRNVSSQTSPVLAPEVQLPENPRIPDEYRLRQAPNRLQLAAAFGADADSEAAVEAGLKWLASTQSQDGSWIAAQFAAGTETLALGEDRSATGDKADTGVTGLALLAFLSAGHTHLEGEYQRTVLAGIQFLLNSQMYSGDMSGPKLVGNDRNVLYSRMYCHSIASLALAEAYAMTLDSRMRNALLKAAEYSTYAQDKRGGGWRYRPLDQGDLSQFGWQAMSLKSVERSGIRLAIETKPLMRRFLDSCQTGTHGGLATYRPGEGHASDTMTAEALACRLLLDYPLSLEAQQEAISMIMRNRPGNGEDNVYFWYYATLALFQLQDENWRDWNQAMKSRLLSTQSPAYAEQPGSWNPDALWGGYGGRVYSTAMSCLCLEVYYRYLPMYRRNNLARTPTENNFSR